MRRSWLPLGQSRHTSCVLHHVRIQRGELARARCASRLSPPSHGNMRQRLRSRSDSDSADPGRRDRAGVWRGCAWKGLGEESTGNFLGHSCIVRSSPVVLQQPQPQINPEFRSGPPRYIFFYIRKTLFLDNVFSIIEICKENLAMRTLSWMESFELHSMLGWL